MNKTMYIPLLAMISTVFIWGLSFLSIKVTLGVFPHMTLALIRFIFAVVFLFFMQKLDKESKGIDRKDIPVFIVAGLTGVTLYFMFENNAINLISASAASIIVATLPIMTLLADTLIFRVALGRNKILSVLLSVLGVYLVVGMDSSEFKASGLGYLLMFGANLVWIIYSYITRALSQKYSQISIVYYQTLFGTVFLIPFIFFEKTNWSMVTVPIMLNVAFLGILCSAVAAYLYVISLDKLGVNVSSVFINLVPVVTVAASYFILKENVGWFQITGGLLVIAAVYIANLGYRDSREVKEQDEGEAL